MKGKGSGPMNANQMKHAASLEEWTQRIMACRASGHSVKVWCKDNEVSPSTYYRWEREIFRQIEKPGTEEDVIQSEALVPSMKQNLVEVPLGERTCTSPEPTIQFCPVAAIRVGQMEVSLTNAASGELIKQLKELFPQC